jgi:hypothetical protein
MLLMILALAAAPLDCSSPSSIAEVGTPIIEAWRSGRTEEAKSKVDALITACPDPVAFPGARVIRADIAYGEGDFAGVLQALDGVPRGTPSTNSRMASILAMRSAVALNDPGTAFREKAQLMAAATANLTSEQGEVGARLVEINKMPEHTVIGIEGDYANGPFKRHLTFLIIPADPLEPPRTIMLTTSPATQLLGVSNSYALDEYTCDRHVTLDWIKSPTQPTYNAVRERVLAHLEVAIDGVSASSGPADAVCAFAAYLAPGFQSN